METLTTCKYGNHEYDTQKVGTGYIYTDIKNGIKENTLTCPACYLSHLQKFYPKSRLTLALTPASTGKALECKHERGWIENHRRIPATYEMPSEETGRVSCSACGEEWTLGYEPEGMELKTAY